MRDSGKESEANVTQALADAESGKPLTDSTFAQEMETVNAALDRAERDSERKDRSARRREILFFLAGLAAGLLGLVV